MKNNPILNAILAFLYIVVIVTSAFYGGKYFEGKFDDFSILQPIGALSLFVLSAAVMGYLFVYDGLRLYLDGDKSRAVSNFLKTVGTFAIITVLVFATLLISKL